MSSARLLCTLIKVRPDPLAARSIVFRGPVRLSLPPPQSPGDFASRVLVALCNDQQPYVPTSLWELDVAGRRVLDKLLTISYHLEGPTSDDPPLAVWKVGYADLALAYTDAVGARAIEVSAWDTWRAEGAP